MTQPEGMPYQTLIASVLHKFVTGRLEEHEPGRSSAARPERKAPTRRPRRGDA